MADQAHPKLKDTQLGKELYDYLYSQKSLPKVQTEDFLQGDLGQYNRIYNLIKLLNFPTTDTVTHEYTHAADTALEKQYHNRAKNNFYYPEFVPETPTYFTDAYEKLVGGVRPNFYKNQRQAMAQKMAPEWFIKNSEYRANNRELAGWGLGRQAGMSNKDGGYMAPDHIDSTMATEMSILMELARRNDKPFPKQPSWFERLFGR